MAKSLVNVATYIIKICYEYKYNKKFDIIKNMITYID